MKRASLRPSKDERRNVIIAAASEKFQEEGYAETSMSSIAATIGGSKGTLYNYFRNKEELFEACLQQHCSQIAEAAFDRLGDDMPLDSALTALGERFLVHVCSEDAVRMLQLIVAESRRSPELARMFYEAGPASGIERLTDYLERAKTRGELTAPDCTAAARVFLVLCRGHTQFMRLLGLEPPPSATAVKAEIKNAVDLFLSAYGAGAGLASLRSQSADRSPSSGLNSL